MRLSGTQPLVEGVAVPVVYADGVAAVELNGPNVRVTLYENRTIAGEAVRVPVIDIIGPANGLKDALETLGAAIEPSGIRLPS